MKLVVPVLLCASSCFAYHPFKLQPAITVLAITGDGADGTIASGAVISGVRLAEVTGATLAGTNTNLTLPTEHRADGTLFVDLSAATPGDYTLHLGAALTDLEQPLTLQQGDPGDDGNCTSAAGLAALDVLYVEKSGATMSGEITYSPPLLRHYFIPPNELIAAPAGFRDVAAYALTDASQDSTAHASLRLPSGAQLVTVTCTVKNPSLAVDIALYEDLGNAAGITQCAKHSWTASGSAHAETFDASACPAVNNAISSPDMIIYVLGVSGLDVGYALYGCSVAYTVMHP